MHGDPILAKDVFGMRVEEMLQEQVLAVQTRLGVQEAERQQLLRVLRAHETFLGAIRAATQRNSALAASSELPPELTEDLLEWLAVTGTREERWLLRGKATKERMARLIQREPHVTVGEVDRLLWLREKAEYEKAHNA